MRYDGLLTKAVSMLLLAVAVPAIAHAQAPAGVDAVLRGQLFDARQGVLIPEGVVVMSGQRIQCAGAAKTCQWPSTARVHDYGKAVMLPGLIDLHVHARPHYVGTFLPSGVTTIRDANNTLQMVNTMRTQPGAARVLASGPALDSAKSQLAAGGMADTPELDTRMPLMAETPEQAREAINALADAGVEWIKLYSQIPLPALQAAVAAGKERQLPVMADFGAGLNRQPTGPGVDALQAAEAGLATLEHLSGVALAYRRLGGDPLAETLDEALLDQIVSRMAATDMAVVPTLALYMQFDAFDRLPPDTLPGAAMTMRYFDDMWTYQERSLGDEASGQRAAAELRLVQALLPKLRKAGVAIGAGSDLPAAPRMLPGGAIHQELEALVLAGFTPAQALQAATHVAGNILRRDDLGRLEAGALADVLVVDGNPLEQITDTRKVAAVWFQGNAVNLDAAWAHAKDALDAFETEWNKSPAAAAVKAELAEWRKAQEAAKTK